MSKAVKKKIAPKPVKQEPVIEPVKPNLDELTAIHTELINNLSSGGTVESRTLLAERLSLAIEALK